MVRVAASQRIVRKSFFLHTEGWGYVALGFVPSQQELFKLAGRPFKESKHQAPCQRQVHLGLLNDFIEFQNGNISIKPRVGKVGELILILQEMKEREPRTASAAEVLHLAGSMVFLFYS